tara:strand:+ start:3627 stop:3797 length:171 start_codon:yes stop_codon:yes gene_type:complete
VKVEKIKKICKSVIEWLKPLGMTEDMFELYEEDLLYRDAKEDWQKMNEELQHADDR